FSFFFTHTATTEIYTLSLHDALPICGFACWALTRAGTASAASMATIVSGRFMGSPFSSPIETTVARPPFHEKALMQGEDPQCGRDRKSTRLNSSHDQISYAVFCLKKK